MEPDRAMELISKITGLMGHMESPGSCRFVHFWDKLIAKVI